MGKHDPYRRIREDVPAFPSPCPVHGLGTAANDFVCIACWREADALLRELDLARLNKRRPRIVLRESLPQ